MILAVVISGCASGSAASAGAGSSTSGAPAPSAGSSAASVGTGSVKRDVIGAVEACALLTAEQIEAAIGTAVTETVPYGTAECRWTVEPLPEFPGSERPWLDVQFFENDNPMRAVEVAPGTEGVVAVDGLGDRSFRTNVNHHLWVQYGTDVFVVRSSLPAISDETEASQAAAEAIEVLLARLVLDELVAA